MKKVGGGKKSKKAAEKAAAAKAAAAKAAAAKAAAEAAPPTLYEKELARHDKEDEYISNSYYQDILEEFNKRRSEGKVEKNDSFIRMIEKCIVFLHYAQFSKVMFYFVSDYYKEDAYMFALYTEKGCIPSFIENNRSAEHNFKYRIAKSDEENKKLIYEHKEIEREVEIREKINQNKIENNIVINRFKLNNIKVSLLKHDTHERVIKLLDKYILPEHKLNNFEDQIFINSSLHVNIVPCEEFFSSYDCDDGGEDEGIEDHIKLNSIYRKNLYFSDMGIKIKESFENPGNPDIYVYNNELDIEKNLKKKNPDESEYMSLAAPPIGSNSNEGAYYPANILDSNTTNLIQNIKELPSYSVSGGKRTRKYKMQKRKSFRRRRN